MIKSVYLENWKTHLKSEFVFEKGTNVIVGKMGAGKSAVMDAISFALYGTFPALASRKVTLEETIMSKPLRQEKAVVRLKMDYKGREYEAERIVKRNGMNEASLRENGKLIAGPKTTDVTKKVEEMTEASYDLFSRAIYSEQNQLDFFLKLSPSQRKEKFDELLGIDKYEKARTNAVTLANRVKKLNEERKAFLLEQKKRADTEKLEEYELKAGQRKEEASRKKNELEEADKKAAIAEKKMRELDGARKQHATLREALARARSGKEAAESHLGRIREKISATSQRKAALEKKGIESLMEKIAEEMKAADAELEALEKKSSIIREKIAVSRSQLRANEKSLDGIQGLGAECPVCRKPLSSHDTEKLAKELAGEKARLAGEAAAAEKESGMVNEAIGALKKARQGIEERREKARKEADALERALEAAKELEDSETKARQAGEAAGKAEEALAAHKFDEEEAEKAAAEFYAIREDSVRLRAEIRSSEEMAAELEKNIRRIKETGANIKKLEQQIAEAEKHAEKLGIFGAALRSIQEELRTIMVETVNGAMEDVWPRIYPYGDFSGAKISAQEGSYEIMVKQLNGEWVRAEGILSGGERSSVALTTRIAVSLVLTQNLGWIILDEPTHNLDANAVTMLGETMKSHLPGLIEQVFIITHDKEMENAATGRIYVLEREKEKDGPTRIA